MLQHKHTAIRSGHAAISITPALQQHHAHLLLYCSNPWVCRGVNRSSQPPNERKHCRRHGSRLVQAAAGTPPELTMQEAAPGSAVEVPRSAPPDPHEAVAERLQGCPVCNSAGRVPCKECEGRGFLRRGGYMKKNPLNMSRIIGSKWTAMEETMGWRHFRVIQQRKLDKHTPFLLLQASCDHGVQLWVNAQTLRDRSSWAAGWLQMSEVQGLGLEIQGSKCQVCSGLGYKPCMTCDGTGRAQLVIL